MMINKSQAISLDTVLGKARNRIYRIAIELEGGWQTPPKGCEIVRDGSVSFRTSALVAGNLQYIGELQSGPIEVSTFPAWMHTCYPAAVNETCGMHIHMSFKEAFRYARLMRPEFPATVLDYVGRWAQKEGLGKDHPIWARLRGERDHCQPLYWADLQIKTTSKDYDKTRKGHRYTTINYPYGRYKTIECRLLPMMETEKLGIKAVQHVLDITNAFLVVTAKRQDKTIAQLDDDGSELTVHRQEYV